MKTLKESFALLAFLFLMLPLTQAQNDAVQKSDGNFNIEGIFSCDNNGKYYVRQIGNEILWFGEDDNINPSWSNVAHGSITSGNLINLIWGDVPKGSIMQHGKLILKINSNDNFTLESQEGDPFGSTVWNRITQ